ncbi:MAG: response regulator [Chthoniobacter sp.]|uniref:response regulator n=1 Tax=Chthoniobacter sp. TaxID=2510640 RepID=UPI0032A396D9
MPTLRIKLPDQGEVTHDLTADRVSVGRRPDNTIQVVDRSVSAHHAELICEEGHYRLHDLGSTNLTFVDGSPVTDFHLRSECRITFGTVQCEFDPRGGSALPRLSISQMEKDMAFMRGENADLLGQIVALQRQVDILSSARLVTKKVDNTPFAASNDALKTIVAERDDLRHLTAGLKLELEKLKDEIAVTNQERDAARQACELMQAEKVAHSRELHDLRQRVARGEGGPVNGSPPSPAPSAPPPEPSAGDTVAVGSTAVISRTQTASAPPSSSSAAGQPTVTLLTPPENTESTQRITLPLSPALQAIASPLKCLIMALNRLSTNINDRGARAQLATQGSKLAQAASVLGNHPIHRISLAIEQLLQECVGKAECPAPAQIQTLSQATDLITSLLDPRHHDRAKGLPHPKVLAVDDDNDLLHTLAATLELAQLSTTTCSDSNTAEALIGKEDYDLLLLDEGLPNLNGPTLCDRVRGHDRYRKTPVIFMTVANPLDPRAQASLSGGNDFLSKPFNTAELTVKAETWIWKNRLGFL